MKKTKSKTLLFTLIFLLLSSSIIFASVRFKTETNTYMSLQESVYYPKNVAKGTKLPVVFLAHNGFEDKSAWKDFPQQLADEGFFAVNITWKAWDTVDVETAIDYTLNKYADKIDLNKVSFIGGCHGGKDLLEVMSHTGLKYKITSAVSLSVAEDDQGFIDTQKVSHPPILVYYSLHDHLGSGYQKVIEEVANKIITEPKKVITVNDTAHGTELVTKAATKTDIRKNIIDWIKSHNK